MPQTAEQPEQPAADEDATGNGNGNGNGADEPLVATDALPKDAARALRRLLREKGWSQIDLHKRLGVTEATVSRWLSRRQGMPFSTLQRICDVLEVPLSAILVPGATAEGDPVALVRQITEQQERWGGWLERATTWRDETGDHLQRIEAAQAELRNNQDQLRRALRQVPLYQQNHRGDPRLGEGDPNAALAIAYAQLPPGATHRTVGERGFALLVNNAVVADLGVRRGDVVFVNPDAAYTAGSLVAVGAAAGALAQVRGAPQPGGGLSGHRPPQPRPRRAGRASRGRAASRRVRRRPPARAARAPPRPGRPRRSGGAGAPRGPGASFSASVALYTTSQPLVGFP
jgi:transcriptional regulator with XRE-family HTH domain